MICSHCGISYEEFKTGLTFEDVFMSFWSTDEDPKTWKHKRRNTILGRWHQWKLELWEQHKKECSSDIPFTEVDEAVWNY